MPDEKTDPQEEVVETPEETTGPTLDEQLEAATQANEELLGQNKVLIGQVEKLVAAAGKHEHHVATRKGQIKNLKKGVKGGVPITRHS